MAKYQFGSMPTWWLRQNAFLSNLTGNNVGEGIAAMKCLLAFSVLIDFQTREVDVSITDLESITGLSRPMVIKGVARLEALKIIAVDKTNYRHNYKLLNKSTDIGWAKVPVDLMRRQLKAISNRGSAPFVALKIYITFLGLRPNNSVNVKISHEKIREYTRVQGNQIRAGLDVLFSCSIIHLQPRDELSEANEYRLLGLSV
ncbi:hypothetical protein ABMY16_21495 [Vibrio vulnificus]|uniref:hypothetical protein n=1 Tax=Vibrio vulnificus TaxID=672 RepID=UPI0040581DAB